MKDSLVQQCLGILKREDIKQEMRVLFSPILNILLQELNPYIYVIILLVVLLFLMILAILILLILLMRTK
jgi:hypothetical protein